MADVVKILSIDGGGIRGIIPALVLETIEERTGRPISALFDLIAGTSKGGVIALGLTKPDEDGRPAHTAKKIVDLYETWGPRTFSRSIGQRLRTCNGILKEKYSCDGFNDMVAEYLGDARLSDALTDVLITAYDTERRCPFFFKSAKARSQESCDFLMRLAALATAAAPTYFEPLKLETDTAAEYYSLIDGGVYANNPAMCAYADVMRHHPNGEVLLVSLGTGELTRPLPYDVVKEWGLFGWARPMLDVVFDGVSNTTNYQLCQLLGSSSYHRFQVTLDQRSERIDDASRANLRALRLKAEQLIESRSAELDVVCERLGA
jgi:patatin-like phospholipase/acyl hydrolase